MQVLLAPFLLTSLLALAMNQPQDGPASRAQQPQKPATPATPPGLSEEEFKALHELRKDKAPPAKGTLVEIAGTKHYLSLPEGGKPPLAAILVIHEWWGLNDHIKHWTDRLAADGYAALAVDLYGGKVAEKAEDAMLLMRAVDEKKAVETMKAAHEFLVKDSRTEAPRTGVIGWCFGGTMSCLAAIAIPELDAAVIYYGSGVVVDAKELKKVRARVLAIFGDRDKSIPFAKVRNFDEALTEAGVRHEILRFDADHAFANPSGAKYDKEASAKAWARVRDLFAKELKAAPAK